MQNFADQIPVSIKVTHTYHDVISKSVPSGNCDNPGASVDTYIAALDDALNTFRSHGVPAELPQLFSDLAHRASKEGLGDKEFTALIEMLS
ncbi:MAG: imine reductase family protein [Paracoccaceae bacterium]